MSIIVSEVYDALISAGAPEEKAKAAAAAIPVGGRLATKDDIARLETEIKVLKFAILHLRPAHSGLARQARLFPELRACQTITDFCVLGAAGWIV